MVRLGGGSYVQERRTHFSDVRVKYCFHGLNEDTRLLIAPSSVCSRRGRGRHCRRATTARHNGAVATITEVVCLCCRGNG